MLLQLPDPTNTLRRTPVSRFRQQLPCHASLFSKMLLCGMLLLCASLRMCPPAAFADDKLATAEQAAFQAAVAKVAPAVVQLETFGGLERVGDEFVSEGPTTGTVVSPDGWIISSLYSFRQQPASILVTLPSGQRAPARIVARDHSRELALLKVDTDTPLPTASFRVSQSEKLTVGQWVVALGKTYDSQNVSQSVGILSALGRAYGRAIQTDAKVSPINYGGPLVDLQGRVIGILAPISPGPFFEGDSSQLYDSGIGFAIPIEDIQARLAKLKSGEDIRPGRLGIVTDTQNEFAGPVQVVGAMPGSPAARAGVKAGDFLIAAQGSPIRILANLRHALRQSDADTPFKFTVLRENSEIEMSAELVAEVPIYRRRYLGLRLSQVDAGLRIDAIEPDSPASNTELALGDIIVGQGEEEEITAETLRRSIAVAELDVPLKLQVAKADSGNVSWVEITADVWPTELSAKLPAASAELDEAMQVSDVEINLGDFPNQAYAIIPPLANNRPLGLLIVLPEPGELAKETTRKQWEEFSKNHGWIVAVVNSGNPERWTVEEVELVSRVLGRMQKGYTIDPARTVIGGLGVGGRLAVLAANNYFDRFAGAMTIGSNLARLRLSRRNAPLQSIDFLLVGALDTIEPLHTQLDEGGFSSMMISADNLEPQKLESHPQASIEKWLEGLARY